jgi:hypothetical protein
MKENPSSDTQSIRLPNIPLLFMEPQISLVHPKEFVILEVCQPTSALRKSLVSTQAVLHYLTSASFGSIQCWDVERTRFFIRESKEPRAGRVLCWLEATYSSSITAGWCCWVHISSHPVPATPFSRAAVSDTKSSRTSYLEWSQ